jgi:dimethylamine monooxygenase subunit C
MNHQPLSVTVSELPNFSLHSNVKKMLLLLEESTFFEHIAIMDYLTSQKIETEIYLKTKQIPTEINKYVKDKFRKHQPSPSAFSLVDVSGILNQQTIGTHLFISGKWPMIQTIKERAYEVGFSENEIQTMAIGPKEEKVFCVKCYSYNLKKQENEISCDCCNTSLSVSNHFSKRINAYLGYINIG